MNKQFLINFATGIFAKLIRYALVASGGVAAVDEGSVLQTASGVAAIVVSIGWSLWEDRMKSKAKTENAKPVNQ